jgi:hypothetical protein
MDYTVFLVVYIQNKIKNAAINPAIPSFIIEGKIKDNNKVEGRYSKNTLILPSLTILFDNNKPEILKL